MPLSGTKNKTDGKLPPHDRLQALKIDEEHDAEAILKTGLSYGKNSGHRASIALDRSQRLCGGTP